MQEHARSARAHVRERQGEEHFGMWPFTCHLNRMMKRDSEMRGELEEREGKGDVLNEHR